MSVPIGYVAIDSTIYRIHQDQKKFNFVDKRPHGYVNHFTNEIHIAPGLSGTIRLKTLFHEIVHIWNKWRLGNVLAESHCDQLAGAMFSLLYENPFISETINEIREKDDIELRGDNNEETDNRD